MKARLFAKFASGRGLGPLTGRDMAARELPEAREEPDNGRRWTSHRPRSVRTTTAARTCGRRPRPARLGNAPGSASSRCARHANATGQVGHPGRVGRQTVSPSSMTASLNSPAFARGRTEARDFSRRSRTSGSRTSPSSRVQRAATRRPFASSAITGRPNAIAATARAVYRPDARKGLELGDGGGEAPRPLPHDPAGRHVQVVGAGVVAGALPDLQHPADWGARERLNGRERAHEPLEVRRSLRDAGLLEEDLRDPDPVRIPIATPRQRPLVETVPSQEGRSESSRERRRGRRSGAHGPREGRTGRGVKAERAFDRPS